MSRSGSEDGTADTKNGTKQEMTNGPTKVESEEPQTDKRAVSLRCLICEAQATGFHFDAQSCSACAAFFRRTVALKKTFECITRKGQCVIHYSMHQICRFCRHKKCLEAGMKESAVQPRRVSAVQHRTFCTKSGLKRNKRFAWVQPQGEDEKHQVDEIAKRVRKESSPNQTAPCSVVCVASPASESGSTDNASTSDPTSQKRTSVIISCHASPPASVQPKVSPLNLNARPSSSLSTSLPPTPTYFQASPSEDVLSWLVREEMRLGERRRIMFCDHPVETLLGHNKKCPYTREEIRPLCFRDFRKSIRTHILFIYEWLQTWPDYSCLDNDDKVSFLRKCVLFHTILDPVYISMQIGYPDKFVMQNGGYVSAVEGCEEGWEDEPEISGRIKKMIYQPLLKRIMEEILPPMLELQLTFEEFVALKAFVSWQGGIPNVSVEKRDIMRKQLDAITQSLHAHYVKNGLPAAERLGSIILLLSNIFSTGLDFVESHRQIEFFDLWNLDSLLLQLLNLDTILEDSKIKQGNANGNGKLNPNTNGSGLTTAQMQG
ncbi:hypothetical protein WR25_08940 [Diploscapter pachys]|uniref:Nuclear receptor domain-containing protein n=1 Tax=Diploscapter pachys TaxID=2018661 RepID=A0A2A2LSS3_9BILA|nr:hypothetical protein WR25_08940 [Diploscapter pachys]